MDRSRWSSVAAWSAWSAASAVALLAIGPLLVMGVTSLGRQWRWPLVLPPEWSLRAWAALVSPGAGVDLAIGESLGVAVAVTTVSLVLAVPAARALALYRFPGHRQLLLALLLPVLTPPLAAAMGLHVVFLHLGLTDTRLGVALAHLVPAVPYATLMLVGSFSRFDPDLEWQARTLGASRYDVWRRVTLPALAPGLAVAGAFAFLISWSQYLLTLLIGGGHVVTLPLLVVGFVRGGDDAVAAALSLVFVAPTLIVFGSVARHVREH